MILPRRQFLRLARNAAFGAAGISCISGLAAALAFDYPTRPVRIVEGFGAGGTPDLTSRLTGQWLAEHLGQPFVVENRPGAGSNIAAQTVAAAAPDGYTLLTCLTANSINETLYQKLDFVFTRDFAPVAGMVTFPMVFLVNPSFPAKTFPELIAYAKANPGKLNIASPGNGTPMHMSIELLKMMTGIDIVHVPYRGPAGAMNDLIAGQIPAFVVTVSTALGNIRAGKIRPLAVTSLTRSEVLPDVPSVAEILPGFEAVSWSGTCAPKATPAPIVDMLSASITAGFADPQFKARIRDIGGDVRPTPAAEFAKFIGMETSKWAKVIKFAGVKAD